MIRFYEAYLVFVGVIWAGSLMELNDTGLVLFNISASSAYLSLLVLELIRLKRPRWFMGALVVDCAAIAVFALMDQFWAPAEVYLHWLDLTVLAFGLFLVLLRSVFGRPRSV